MSKVTVLRQGETVSEPAALVPRTSSYFPDTAYRVMGTQQFGTYYPFFAMETVPSDAITFGNSHRVRSYTLKAPLLSDVFLRKDYFCVYNEAILPFNWDKVYTNPVVGDDVATDVNSVMPAFFSTGLNYLRRIVGNLATLLRFEGHEDVSDEEVVNNLCSILQTLVFLERFFSDGALINVLGCNLSGYFVCTDNTAERPENLGFDFLFDTVVSVLDSSDLLLAVNKVNLNGSPETLAAYTFVPDGAKSVVPPTGQYMNTRSLIEYLRENPCVSFTSMSSSDDLERFVTDFVQQVEGLMFSIASPSTEQELDLNFSRLAAYQLVINHFYTNDAVDFVYSAELFRQAVSSVLVAELGTLDTFVYNGITTNYDYLSGHYFSSMLASAANELSYPVLVYFSYLLGFRRSLRYVDYYTAAKSRPLAVGETSIDVNDSQIDVVDVTRNIQLQRFLNAINRFGRKFGSYISGLFDVVPQQDFHNPAYLTHVSDLVSSSETQNTGAAQVSQAYSITSTLEGGSSDFTFTFRSDRPSILIGISYFDIPRLYSWNTDKFFLHADRFDMFNPMMQFTGDRELSGIEVSSYRRTSRFGYVPRYQEYKQRVSRAVGGFVRHLPGWAFVADAAPGLWQDEVISPEYIRSSCVELDPFYVSLTGYSLGTYFHFITVYDNRVQAVRPMAFSSQIL